MRDLAKGFRYLLEGQRWVAAHRRSLGLGLVPGLISVVLYLAALITLALSAGDIVDGATPFADTWSSPRPGLLRGFLAVLLVALGLLLSVVTFTAVTPVIGHAAIVRATARPPRAAHPTTASTRWSAAPEAAFAHGQPADRRLRCAGA